MREAFHECCTADMIINCMMQIENISWRKRAMKADLRAGHKKFDLQ